ncbi:MAG TPA: hypothetical protein VHM19_02015 [Polyangiales bacterium]|nr:hypothetical protein [Polyangiales bacterium]
MADLDAGGDASDVAETDAQVADAGTLDDAAVSDAGMLDDAAVADAGNGASVMHIVDSQPTSSSKGVTATSCVMVSWSVDVSVSTISSVTLRDHLGASIAGSFLVPGDDQGGFYDSSTDTYYPLPVLSNAFVFIPSARLLPGEKYSMDFGGLQGVGGELVANGESLSFTVVDPVQLVAGGIHNLMLERDGSVWGWGGSIYGAAGSGATSTTVWTPTRVLGLAGYGTTLPAATQVAASEYASLALLSDGTVAAWGMGDQGQLGDGQTYASGNGIPVHVSSLTHVTAVAAGGDFGLALKDDGTVWAWGAGDQGQLGTGGTSGSSTPVQVQTSSGVLGKVVAIAAGTFHALALTSDGDVVAWGDNASGQCGTSGADLLVATPVAGLSNVEALSARNNHSLALDTAGKVYQWGAQEKKLGGGITWTNITTPTLVTFPAGASTTITAIRAGYHHFLARADDGTLYSWGLDYYGELFGTAGVDRPTPEVAASFASSLLDFSAGGAFAGTHSLYATTDAQIVGRGSNKSNESTGFP